MPKQYDAFLSYSHDEDRHIAIGIERGLKRFSKRWNQFRALEVFRDEASLSASPHLWDSLAHQLDASRFLVVLLSPESAKSEWVDREIDHFLQSHSEERLLLVVTAGKVDWDNETGDWTTSSESIPPSLWGRLRQEPLWVDLRWARGHNERMR